MRLATILVPCLAKIEYTLVRCCLFGVCELLRDSRKVCSISQDRSLVWKSHGKWLRWAQRFGGAGYQGITRTGLTNNVSQVDRDLGMMPVCVSRPGAGRTQQQSSGFWQHLSLGGSCPSRPHSEARQSSSSSYVPWHLLSCCPSPGTQSQ